MPLICQLTYIVLYQSFKTKANAKYFVSIRDRQTYEAANSGVHTTSRCSNVHYSHGMKMLQTRHMIQ